MTNTTPTSTAEPPAQPENRARQQIKLAREAYDALEPLSNITWQSYREQLLKMCIAEEKDHRGFMPDFRESHTPETASVIDAAKLFAVKRLAEYLNGDPMPKGRRGALFCRTTNTGRNRRARC